MTAFRLRQYRKLATSAAVLLAIGYSMFTAASSAQSLTDRFKSLFGGESKQDDVPAGGSSRGPSPS